MDPTVDRLKFYLLILASLIVSPLFFILIRFKKRAVSGSGLKILIIPQLTRIGDLVCSTPVFAAIKKTYPQSRLAVLVSSKAAGILKNNPRIDDLLIYENQSLNRLIKKLRREKFDWSFSLSGTALSSLIAFLGIVPNRVKTVRQNRPASEILTDWLNNFKLLYRHHAYLPEHHLKLLRFIGIDDLKQEKEIFTGEQSEEKARDFFRQNGISENDFLVGMSVSAGNKAKEWPAENFKKVARHLIEKRGAKIIFIGSAADESRINEVSVGLKEGGFFKSFDSDLANLPSLIKRLKLFISVDTGPVHVAHALKIPLVDIVGPVDPNELVPRGENIIAVKSGVPPSIFSFKEAGDPRQQRLALDSIKTEQVEEAVESLIRSAKESANFKKTE